MMTTEQPRRYLPYRRRGAIFLGALILIILVVSSAFFWIASITSEGVLFAVYLALGVAAILPLPMLGYRFFALLRAYYDLNRDTLTIHWGLRTEILPIRDIHWIRPVADLVDPLPPPKLLLPGAMLGLRSIEGLGKVEYMADRMDGALLVASPTIVYVISPEDVSGFMAFYSRGVELGSLESISAESIQPSFIIGKLWDDRIIRNLILSGFLIGVGVALWSILIITSRSEVVFGYQAAGSVDPVPGIRLLLLPVINGLIFLVDIVTSAFFYRRDDQRIISYLVCSGSSVTGILLLLALFQITINP